MHNIKVTEIHEFSRKFGNEAAISHLNTNSCIESYNSDMRLVILYFGLINSKQIQVRLFTPWIYRVAQYKSKYMYTKTDNIRGAWISMNNYGENEVLSDIFTWNILCHYPSMSKYSVTESS